MTEEEKKVNALRHVNHSKRLDRILFVLILIWALLLFGLLDDHLHAADLPHYADLTFTDIPDLDAWVDSVLAVCDTVMPYKADSVYIVYPPADIDWAPYYKGWINGVDTLYWDIWMLTITCRQWAGLTVFSMPDSSRSYSNIIIRDSIDWDWEEPDGSRWRAHLWDQHPGKARLWWWEEEE